MKKRHFFIIISFLLLPWSAYGESGLAGRILLQVEGAGQAWYVSPADGKRYGLGRPEEAFALMRKLSVGISDKDLAKIPVGVPANDYPDSDADGLSDGLEEAIGSDKYSRDTDADGYNDNAELAGGYDPLGSGKQPLDKNFTKINSGRIFLQVEKNGEAWYVEPVSLKRYYLGRPNDAFRLMRAFGLGITDADLDKIPTGLLPAAAITAPAAVNPAATSTVDILQSAAAAIRAVDTAKTKSYFIAGMAKSIEYSLNHMSKDNLLLLANILSGSTLKSSTADKKTYTNKVYFHGETRTVYFYAEKQAGGDWLIANL